MKPTPPAEWAKAALRFAQKWVPVLVRPELGHCWEWTGATKKPSPGRAVSGRRQGGSELPYGLFWFRGKIEAAHRFAFAHHHGREVSSLGLIGHRCDNACCVRPSHLHETVPTVNLREAYERGRRPRVQPGRRIHGKRGWVPDPADVHLVVGDVELSGFRG